MKSFMDVFGAEMGYVRQRWRRDPERRMVDAETPTTRNGLVGLALSGGGIRSATLNLGLLQALRKWGLLRHVDYLSTVSGGGFIGSCVSALAAEDRLDELLGPSPDGHEPSALTWLRDHSNYLTPNGGTDWLRIMGVFARGAVINILLVLPLVVFAAVLAWVPYRYGWWDIRHGVTFTRDPLPLFTIAVLLYGFWIFLSPLMALRARSVGWRDRFERSFGSGILLMVVALVVDLQPYILNGFHQVQAVEEVFGNREVIGLVVAGLSFFATVFGREFVQRLSGTAQLVAMTTIGVLGPLLPYLGFLFLTDWLLSQQKDAMWPTIMGLVTPSLCLLLWGFAVVDINLTSVHPFYRDRLSDAFLVGRDALTPLSSISTGNRAPYHLLNVALNVPASRDPRLRGRNSDFFFFSRLFVGSDRTGYQPTRKMEEIADIGLGSAMAISGAAAAPNMGTYTSPLFTFLLAVLNVRMGFWLPNPRRVDFGPKTGQWARFHWRPNPRLLYQEMLGLLTDRGYFVNLSDGGHLENTGIYQLLRRRCRFIICGDGEDDAAMAFGGFATLLRFARMDLGVEIDIDLSQIRRGPDGNSLRHAAVGRIRYPEADGMPAEVGYLLYVKSSVTGAEDEIIKEYRARNPLFPHETTADQFFDEAQFEAYRSLGESIGDRLLGAVLHPEERGNVAYSRFGKMVLDLAVNLAPAQWAKAEIDLTRTLDLLEAELAQGRHDAYNDELYPERTEEGLADLVHIVNRQLQLMENVVLSLGMDRAQARDAHTQRGWMNLFRRWAGAPSFQRVFPLCITGFTTQFQHFCEAELRLDASLVWRRLAADERWPEPVRPARELDVWRLVLETRQGAIPVAGAHLDYREGKLRQLTLLWCDLRAGYEGSDQYQRALSALHLYARWCRASLHIPRLAMPPRYRDAVAADIWYGQTDSMPLKPLAELPAAIAGEGVAASAMGRWGTTHFFVGQRWVTYDLLTDRVAQERRVSDAVPGWTRVDGALGLGPNRSWLFSGDRWVEWDPVTCTCLTQPGEIPSDLPFRKVDAAVSTGATAWFFLGDEVASLDLETWIYGDPRPIEQVFPNLGWTDVDDVIDLEFGEYVFFKGDRYRRYDLISSRVVGQGLIREDWPGVLEA